MVTRRHFVDHALVELGPSSVEESYAGHNRERPHFHPGHFPRFQTPDWFTLQQATGRTHQQTSNVATRRVRKQSMAIKISTNWISTTRTQPRNAILELEISIVLWMSYFKFTYASVELTAYDQGIYPKISKYSALECYSFYLSFGFPASLQPPINWRRQQIKINEEMRK
jgi:hypothetical protein